MKQTHSRAAHPRLVAPLLLGASLLVAGACSEQQPTPAAGSQAAQAPTQPPAANPAADAGAARAPAAAAEAKIETQPALATPTALPGDTVKPATTTNPATGQTATNPTPDKAAELAALVGHEGHDHANESKVDPNAAAGSALAEKPAPGGPAPRLEADANDHDFGTAIEGEKLSHTFKLKSAGQADLIITNAKPTCGCTIAKLELLKADGSAELYKFGDACPPGTDLRLTAELDTKNKHSQASSKINVYCNDPRTLLTLGLTARVDTYFVITPNALQFGEMSVADTAEKSFQVSGKKPTPFMLTLDNKQLPDGMKIDLQPVEGTPEGKATRWDVKVTLGPNCKEGNLGFPIQLRSDEQVAGGQPDKDGALPTYGASVMVTGRIQGLISWEPQYLSFGLVRPGQTVARALAIKSFDPSFTFGEPKVRLVGPSDQKPEFAYTDAFSWVVKPADDKKSVTVELTLNGLAESVDGSFQGRLMLETGHPSKPEVAVLFSGVCRPGVKAAPTPVQIPVPAANPPVDGGKTGG